MHRKLPKLGRQVLLVLLVGSLLAVWAGTGPAAADDQVPGEPLFEDSVSVGLSARTPPDTGCLKLVKEFVAPDGVEFPLEEIVVRVTDPDDVEHTYILKAGDGWEKVICDLKLGTYTVVEETYVSDWEVSYEPASGEALVEPGDVPGQHATVTITNTYRVIGISVSPTEIDFGEIAPSATIDDSPDITVTNTGSVNIDVSAELTDDTPYGTAGDDDLFFYTEALTLNGVFSDQHGAPTELGAWPAADLGLADIAPAGAPEVSTGLMCPAEMYADTEYTGTLVFWAEEVT